MTGVGFPTPFNQYLKSPQLSIDKSTDLLPDNNTWKDYPEDEDRNGFYDRLIIELGMINFTDEFNGIYGILKDKNENLLGTSQIYNYDSGKIASFSFMGQPINAGATDGPYIIEVGVFSYSGWWWWSIPEVNFTHQYITTTSYDYREFEPPAATIVGFSDELVDTNEDQLYDEIIFKLSIEAKDSGYYDIELFMEESSPFSGSNYDLTTHWSGFLTPNGNEVEISYSLHHYIIWDLNGPYNVSYVQLQFYGQDHQFLTSPYSTDAYSVSEFEPSQVKLTGRFFDCGVDLDADGKFEELNISVEVNITQIRGLYEFHIDIDPLDIDQTHWDQTIETEEHFAIGIQNLTFVVDATSFYSMKKNTSFIISDLWIQDPFDNSQMWEGFLYTTRIYSYKEFSSPSAFLTGTNSDYPSDTNKDGLFEELVIEVEINVTQTGLPELELRINLVSFGDNSNLDLWGDYSNYLLKGVQVIPIYFDTGGERFFRPHGNISFLLKSVILRKTDGNMVDFAENFYITQNYSRNIFPTPPAFFTGKYSDQGRDLDNDSKFDELIFTVEVNVTQPIQCLIRLDLHALDIVRNSWDESRETSSSYMEVGKRNITITFDGASIYRIREDTSFIINRIEIYDDNWNTLDRVNSPYITGVYSYNEFQPPKVFFTGRYWDFGFDTDSDEMYNLLDVIMEVNVTQPGSFYFDFAINAYLPVWDSHFRDYIYRSLTTGVQNISLRIYVTLAYSMRTDTAYVFDDISIYDTEDNRIDWVEQPHITRVYAYSEFDPPNAFLTGNCWDQGVDTDLDGTFDELSVNFEVNVSQAGYYTYEFNWYEPEGDFYKHGSLREYWEEGLQNLTISAYSAPLYLTNRESYHVVENIRIYDDEGHFLDRMWYNYDTQVYNWLEFDSPGAVLTNDYWSSPIDSDSDFRYEEILITVGVDVFREGIYTLQLLITCDNPDYKEFSVSVQGLWNEGRNDILVHIPSIYFHSYLDRRFSLEIKLIQLFEGDNDLIHQLISPFWTDEYHNHDFDLINKPSTSKTTAVENPDWRLPFGLLLLVSISLVLFLSHKWRKPSSP